LLRSANTSFDLIEKLISAKLADRVSGGSLTAKPTPQANIPAAEMAEKCSQEKVQDINACSYARRDSTPFV
jgi:hypothetical protein